jgi:antitoxin CptB
MSDELLGVRELSKLKWRCRRGLLENDLFIEKFFARHESGLTVRQAQGLNDLMDLADNDLLDLLLRRREPEADTTTNEVREVLGMLRNAATGGDVANPAATH